MLMHPNFNPIALDLGLLKVHWYGVMYLCAFGFAYWIAKNQAEKGKIALKPEQVEDAIFWGAMGVILGGRIGYVFFYGWQNLVENPLWAFKIWQGGMSFHGGLIGVLVALFLYARRYHIRVGDLFDMAALATPMGLGFGRIGNFINQELWGRPTDLPWGMIFPNDPSHLARHPSQLYQAFLEGLVLFGIIYWHTRKPRPEWSTGAMFIIFYGLFRFLVEFVREPDVQIGFDFFGWMSRGQALSIPMVLAGIILLATVNRKAAAKV